MIDSLKDTLWNLLKDKQISLVMIFNRDLEILWSKGRKIFGKSILEGENYCKSLILKCLEIGDEVHKTDVGMSFTEDGLSESAEHLLVKSVYIIPVAEDYFLYLDSGNKLSFIEIEIAQFKMIANLLKKAIQKIQTAKPFMDGIIGASPVMKKLKELVIKYSLEEDCLLLLGETGVGKSHIAECIHHYSGKRGKFVVADTTTINENLFESIIFGHKKGSFTSALENRKGLVDEAENGTLFFDEIAEVPITFQAKLLRFIETKKYRVLGEAHEKTADVRIIASTNRDLKQLIKNEQFRSDLFYRLNILTINIPPLRERKEDIQAMVWEKQRLLRGKEPGPGFWEALTDHHWPGNYRELFTVLKRLGISGKSQMTGGDVKEVITDNDVLKSDPQEMDQSRIDAVRNRLRNGISFWDAVQTPYTNHELLKKDLQLILKEALAQAGGKYVDVLEIFNLRKSEYKKFMRFLHNNRII